MATADLGQQPSLYLGQSMNLDFVLDMDLPDLQEFVPVRPLPLLLARRCLGSTVHARSMNTLRLTVAAGCSRLRSLLLQSLLLAEASGWGCMGT